MAAGSLKVFALLVEVVEVGCGRLGAVWLLHFDAACGDRLSERGFAAVEFTAEDAAGSDRHARVVRRLPLGVAIGVLDKRRSCSGHDEQ